MKSIKFISYLLIFAGIIFFGIAPFFSINPDLDDPFYFFYHNHQNPLMLLIIGCFVALQKINNPRNFKIIISLYYTICYVVFFIMGFFVQSIFLSLFQGLVFYDSIQAFFIGGVFSRIDYTIHFIIGVCWWMLFILFLLVIRKKHINPLRIVRTCWTTTTAIFLFIILKNAGLISVIYRNLDYDIGDFCINNLNYYPINCVENSFIILGSILLLISGILIGLSAGMSSHISLQRMVVS